MDPQENDKYDKNTQKGGGTLWKSEIGNKIGGMRI